MLKPVPPVPSNSLLYVPTVFVNSVLTQSPDEISESIPAHLRYEFFQVTTFKQVVVGQGCFQGFGGKEDKQNRNGGSTLPTSK